MTPGERAPRPGTHGACSGARGPMGAFILQTVRQQAHQLSQLSQGDMSFRLSEDSETRVQGRQAGPPELAMPAGPLAALVWRRGVKGMRSCVPRAA